MFVLSNYVGKNFWGKFSLSYIEKCENSPLAKHIKFGRMAMLFLRPILYARLLDRVI